MSGFARQGLRLIAKNCRLCQYSTGVNAPSTAAAGAWDGVQALSVAVRHASTCINPSAIYWTQRAAFSALPAQQTGEVPDLQLTEGAIEKLRELTADTGASALLRLTVEAGGCSGFSYKFDLDDTTREGDRVFEAQGVKLVTDSVSYEFVRGAKVDYSQELIKASFEVVDNPNAEKGCGCGSSFAPK